MNDEAFRVVFLRPIYETPVRPISSLIDAGETAWKMYTLAEAGGSVMGDILDHVMDAPNVEMPAPPPLPRFLPVTLSTLTFTPIMDLLTPSPQKSSHGSRSTTRSNATG